MAKVDALAGQAIADEVLYDAGFADGVASVVAPGGISPDQEKTDIDVAVAAAVQPLNDHIASLSLAKDAEDALLAQVKASIQGVLALIA